MSPKRYLILAEGFSHDPHYGKTMYGVLRYRREDVVAILDTQRAGETQDGLQIVATVDEDIHTAKDVQAAAERAHGVNMKLAKSGGIRECVRIAHAARALDLGVMLGCMVESSVAIAAACQVASLCDHVDLDGNLLLADDPWEGVEFVDGVQLPSLEPGLGVTRASGSPLGKGANSRRAGQHT